MASLRFKYAPMNAGKSSNLLQTAYNYEERGMFPLVLKPSIDTKGSDQIVRRAMIYKREVDNLISPSMNIYDLVVEKLINDVKITAILIDEAQFLTKEQIKQLSDITVILDIPVICFGLRTDFKCDFFEGSEALFRYANILEELTTVCICGKKALFNARVVDGKYVQNGSQVVIDGSEECTYISLCPYHYKIFVENIDVKEEQEKIKIKIKKRTKNNF